MDMALIHTLNAYALAALLVLAIAVTAKALTIVVSRLVAVTATETQPLTLEASSPSHSS